MLTALITTLLSIPVAQLIAVAGRAGVQDRPAIWTAGLLRRRPRLAIPFAPSYWHRPSEIAVVVAIPLLTALAFCLWPAALALPYAVFLALLVWASAVDLQSQLIPDESSLGGMLLGFVACGVVPALQHVTVPAGTPFLLIAMKGFAHSVNGAMLGAGLVVLFAMVCEFVLRKEAMGLGDVKLAATIGAFLGWGAAFFSLFGGAAIGVVLLLVIGLARKAVRHDHDPVLPSQPLPFGPLLALGAVIYLFGADRLTASFFGTLQLLAG